MGYSDRSQFLPQQTKNILEQVGLPLWVGEAFECDVRGLIHSNRDWGLPEHEKKTQEQIYARMKKELSEEQFKQVERIYDIILRKSHYSKEYMFYSGVKQGIRFYKEFQSMK